MATKICRSASYFNERKVREFLMTQDLIITSNKHAVEALDEMVSEDKNRLLAKQSTLNPYTEGKRVIWMPYAACLTEEQVTKMAEILGFQGPFEISGIGELLALHDEEMSKTSPVKKMEETP